MTGRKYRSGAQQTCLICRQSEEIREAVTKMGTDHTFGDIVTWLKTKEIDASTAQVRFFLRKIGVQSRIQTISSSGDYKVRMIAYIDQLLKHRQTTYTIHNLGLKGPRWTAVTRRLRNAGMIKPLREYKPIRWEIVSTEDEFVEWRDAEVKRLEEKQNNSHR